MSLGFAANTADDILDAMLCAIPFVGSDVIVIQLHTGPPGSDGAANIAVNNEPRKIAFARSQQGTIASSIPVTWTGVPAAEQYSHFSLFSGDGRFLGCGEFDAEPIAEGERFTIPAGAEYVLLNVASDEGTGQ